VKTGSDERTRDRTNWNSGSLEELKAQSNGRERGGPRDLPGSESAGERGEARSSEKRGALKGGERRLRRGLCREWVRDAKELSCFP